MSPFSKRQMLKDKEAGTLMHTCRSVNGTSVLESNLVIFSKTKNNSGRYSF